MKAMALLGATIFGVLGAYIPFLFGDNDIFSIWSILLSMVGGFFGIWVGVKLYKRFS
jgi:hypothetical protein